MAFNISIRRRLRFVHLLFGLLHITAINRFDCCSSLCRHKAKAALEARSSHLVFRLFPFSFLKIDLNFLRVRVVVARQRATSFQAPSAEQAFLVSTACLDLLASWADWLACGCYRCVYVG